MTREYILDEQTDGAFRETRGLTKLEAIHLADEARRNFPDGQSVMKVFRVRQGRGRRPETYTKVYAC